MKSINTPAGPLKCVTFKEFLKSVPTVKIKRKLTQHAFNTMVGFPEVTIPDQGTESNHLPNYVRKIVPLLKGPREVILKAGLIIQATHFLTWQRPLELLAEDWSIDSLNEFGMPTHLVKLSPKTYMLANPEDFLIYENDQGVGLACNYANRTKIYEILPCTVEQGVKAAADQATKFGVKVTPKMKSELLEDAKKGKFFD